MEKKYLFKYGHTITVHGILQARILVWVAVPFPRGSSQPRDWTQVYPHCRWILYQLSHQGSLGLLEWVACPFSSRSSRPRIQTGVSFISWATRKAHNWFLWRKKFLLKCSVVIYKATVFYTIFHFLNLCMCYSKCFIHTFWNGSVPPWS